LTGDVRPDPAGVQTAIDRYRDLAKYLITIFAGVGALLIAGTQLASIGKLSLADDSERIVAVAVAVGLILATGAIAAIIGLALKILRPIEMTFDDVIDDPKLRAAINKRRSLLGVADHLDQVRDNVRSRALPDEDLESWFVVADDIVAEAAYLRMRETFDGTWPPLLGAAVAGVLGITLFAWGANPPAEATVPGPSVRSVPVEVRISLTDDGREALRAALGGGRCARPQIPALSIGGKEGAPLVVILPRRPCKVAQFLLAAEWGAVVSAKTAPGR